jgi:hypothetical protein
VSRVLSYALEVVSTILHILEFVAMPLGNGYTAEEQVTGQEVRLSLPKLVIPLPLSLSFVDYWGDPDRRISALRYQCRIYTPRLFSRLVQNTISIGTQARNVNTDDSREVVHVSYNFVGTLSELPLSYHFQGQRWYDRPSI